MTGDCVGPITTAHPSPVVVRTSKGDGLCETCMHFYNRATTRGDRRKGLLASQFVPVTEAGRVQLNEWLASVGLPLVDEVPT